MLIKCCRILLTQVERRKKQNQTLKKNLRRRKVKSEWSCFLLSFLSSYLKCFLLRKGFQFGLISQIREDDVKKEEKASRIDVGKEAAIEAEVKAARERAIIPLEIRMKQFRDMLAEKEVITSGYLYIGICNHNRFIEALFMFRSSYKQISLSFAE